MIRLRWTLARDRSFGISFDEVFTTACGSAVRRCASERLDWLEAFRETETAWRAGYDRTDGTICPLTLELLSSG